MGQGVNFSGPLKVNGTTVVDESGSIIGDIQATAGSILKVEKVTLTIDEIVGDSAGQIGHSAGAILVASPGAGKVLEFVSAVLSYTHDTAAYTGGGDDNVIQLGTTAVSPAIVGADLLEAAGDKIAQVTAIGDADVALAEDEPLALHGTALTDPGTAEGTLDVFITYRVHTL
jgi:hypothetical protein